METAITVATIAAAAVVFLLYVAFVRWRIKVHRRRKEVQELGRAGLVDPSRLVELAGHDRPDRTAPAADGAAPLVSDPSPHTGHHAAEPQTAATPQPSSSTNRVLVLADAVSGIELGESFTPLIDARPRPHAIDRAVFSSGTADVAAVRDRVDEALAAIGFTVTWTGLDAAAVRTDAIVAVAVVPEPTTAAIDGALAYPGAMLGNVVVDFWIPT